VEGGEQTEEEGEIAENEATEVLALVAVVEGSLLDDWEVVTLGALVHDAQIVEVGEVDKIAVNDNVNDDCHAEVTDSRNLRSAGAHESNDEHGNEEEDEETSLILSLAVKLVLKPARLEKRVPEECTCWNHTHQAEREKEPI